MPDTNVSNARLELNGALTVAQLGNVVADIKEHAGNDAQLELDLSGVDRIDAAALQLLCLLSNKNSAEASGLGRTRIAQVSQVCADAARFLGLSIEVEADRREAQ